MKTKSAIDSGDAAALRGILSADPTQANALITSGRPSCPILTHPLHYVSDSLFNGLLPKGMELPIVDALIEAGADLDFRKEGKDETPLIGAASLGAEDVGLRLLDAGAQPHLRGNGGETMLHWAGLFGELRLAQRLIEGADLELEDAQYHSTPLGWAVQASASPARTIRPTTANSARSSRCLSRGEQRSSRNGSRLCRAFSRASDGCLGRAVHGGHPPPSAIAGWRSRAIRAICGSWRRRGEVRVPRVAPARFPRRSGPISENVCAWTPLARTI